MTEAAEGAPTTNPAAATQPAGPDAALLLGEAEVAAKVAELAAALAPRLDDDAVIVCLLTGGIWFAADLTRALARLGKPVGFDCLWLTSYGDARASGGRVTVRAGLQRPLAGRQAVVVDDVFDSGLTLREAARLCHAAGAREVLTAVFARKPWPEPRGTQPDHVAWEAPGRFLVGYGMDAAGLLRGLPFVGAMG